MKELEQSLNKIGKIKPWFDDDVNAWVFEHETFPLVRYAGDTEQEVIENYPKYLADYLEELSKDNISKTAEKAFSSGRGGKRENSGRPKGTTKEPGKMYWFPILVGDWLKASKKNLEIVAKLARNDKLKEEKEKRDD
jgi:hypothetical protein